MRTLPFALLSLLAVLSCAGEPEAQTVPRSQLGGVVQNVAGTNIAISYRRPVARERELFGALVPYGRIWSPSADTSAQFSISTPTEINGNILPAGTYGFWAIPDASSWTIIFSKIASVFHLRYPEGQDALRIRVAPQRGEHVETLQFSFPFVDADSAEFQLRWGTTVIPMKLKVRPTGTALNAVRRD